MRPLIGELDLSVIGHRHNTLPISLIRTAEYLCNLGYLLNLIHTGEHRIPLYNLGHNAPKSPHIDGEVIHPMAEELLGRLVPPSEPLDIKLLILVLQQDGAAQIRDLDHPRLGDQDVRRFQVPVDYLVSVQVAQSQQDLLADVLSDVVVKWIGRTFQERK